MNLNEPQKKTVSALLKILPSAHWVNVVVRINGEDRTFQGDWLLDLLQEEIEKI